MTTHCKNCGATIEGKFCSVCGQSAEIGRVNAAYFLHSINKSVMRVDRGFLFTLKELLMRPGKTAKAYVQGKRVRYYSPIALLILLSAFEYLAMHYLGLNTSWEDLLTGYKDSMQERDHTHESEQHMLDFLLSHRFIPLLLVIPFNAAVSRLLFRKQRLNYFEHLLFHVWMTNFAMIWTVALGPLTAWSEKHYEPLMSVLLLIPTIWVTWGYVQFFDAYRLWGVLWRRLLMLAALFLFFSLIMIVAVGLALAG